MKKYIVLILIFCFSFFCFGCNKNEQKLNDLEKIKKRGYLIVGVKTDSAPFGFYNKKNELVGIDIDIAQEIANEIFKNNSKTNVKFIPVTPQNRISKLNSKEVDILVATMSINNKRKLILEFSQPYFVATQKILVRNTSKITYLQYFNKNGKLAVIMGTTGERIAHLIAPNANLVGTKTYTEAHRLLLEKKVDAILGDDCILKGFDDRHLKLINKAYSREFYAVALRKSQDSKELLNLVNSTIASILDNKKLNFISKKWILY